MMFTTARGRFKKLRGTIVCADESDPTRASVEAEIDASSIDTGDENRDAHLRSPDFLDVEHYPKIMFRSTRVERTGAQDELRVVGDLTVRDTTREVVARHQLQRSRQEPIRQRGRRVYGRDHPQPPRLWVELECCTRKAAVSWSATK
jgi:polyisoprenoid-binding protein YceI